MQSLLTILFVMLITAAACDRYEPPPTVTIDGLQSGLLYDSKAPLGLSFGQAIDLATLKVTIAYNETDLEGDLPDEDDNPDTELRVLFVHDPVEGDRGGHLEVAPDGASLQIVHDAALPVGPKLVVLVEPGLTGAGGRTRTNRTRLAFSYTVQCTKGTRAKNLKSGIYFVLLDVLEPLGTQIQLFAALEMNPATGAFLGQFTNADRNPDGARCPTPCSALERCRLLPAPACVIPSMKAGTIDEYPDFVPNSEPPTGYSFAVEGCAVDDGAGAGVVTAPATMVVIQPPVTVEGLTMTAFFTSDAKGVRATGSLTADRVLLGENVVGNGKGKGLMTAVLVPAAQVPPGVPPAPKPAADAGTGGSDGGL